MEQVQENMNQTILEDYSKLPFKTLEGDNDLDKGKYIVNGKSVYVSGGVGSFGTKRFFNFPEFELITLTDGTVIRQNPLEQVLNTISKDDPILNSDAGFKEWERKSSEETETEQET